MISLFFFSFFFVQHLFQGKKETMKWNIFICPLIALVFFVTLCNATDIYTVHQFVALFETSPTSVKNISLKADLDFSTRALFVPLGVKSDGSCVPFRGTLNGNGHSIKNLVMSTQNTDTYNGKGLLCNMNNATIENLVFDKSCNIEGPFAGSLSVTMSRIVVLRNVTNRGFVTGWRYAGGLVGYTYSGSSLTLDHCINEGTINSGTYNYDYSCGGLIGFVEQSRNSTITNCKNTGNLTGGATGGLIGTCQYSVNTTIENSTNSGFAVGRYYSGGLIGSAYVNSMEILHCNNTGIINSSSLSGGFIGEASCSSGCSNITITFIDSHNTGSVKGGGDGVGGFVGTLRDSNITTMINCSNTGNIYSVRVAGGFFGWVSVIYGVLTVKNSKNTGSVLCNNTCGGIIGNKEVFKGSDSIFLESTANYGTVTAENGIACGFVSRKQVE